MRSPEEGKLDFLLGEWTAFHHEPPVQGPAATARYQWEVGGRWLTYRFVTQLPRVGPYEVHGGVAYDGTAGHYVAYAVNSMGNLSAYHGTWEKDSTLAFTLVFPQRQEDTRVSYVREPGGTVLFLSERPRAEGGREVYFETRLARGT